MLLTDTHSQEGSGSNKISTRACHSALISDVKEHFRWKEGEVVSDNTVVCCDNSYQMTSPHLPGHAYFRRMLNSTTVELHTAVNQSMLNWRAKQP